MATKEKWDDSFIVCDTREQAPFWPDAPRVTLTTSDYSVVNLTDKVGVERKSLSDLLGSLGGVRGIRRKRFEAEFERLGKLDRKAVVIEGSLSAIYKVKRWGRVTPAMAIGAMFSWEGRYGVPVHWCEDRTQARAVTKIILRLAWEEFRKAPPSVSNGQGQ